MLSKKPELDIQGAAFICHFEVDAATLQRKDVSLLYSCSISKRLFQSLEGRKLGFVIALSTSIHQENGLLAWLVLMSRVWATYSMFWSS